MFYVQCKFRKEDTRTYCYTWDQDDPLAPGDEVRVTDRSGDGWKKVYVDSVSDEAPPFACKPILGRYEPEPETLEPPANSTAVGDMPNKDDPNWGDICL